MLEKVSVTRIKQFLRCRKAYAYRYIEKLVPKRKPVAMARGIVIHSALEAYYKGQDWNAVLTSWQAEVESKLLPFMTTEEQEEWADMPREIYRIVLGYIKAYKVHDKEFEVMDVEVTGHAILPSGIILEYRLDKVIREISSKLIFISDTKTVKQIPDEQVRFTDIQTAIYAWAHSQVSGLEIAGIMWDYVRTKAPSVPKTLQKGGMSRAKNIDTDWPTYRKELLAAGLDPAEYADMQEALKGNAFYQRIKQGKPDPLVENLVKEVDFSARQMRQVHKLVDEGREMEFPRNLMHDCAWSCPYAQLCFTELAGQPGEWLRNERFESRDAPSGDGVVDVGEGEDTSGVSGSGSAD